MTNTDFFYNNVWSSVLQQIHDTEKIAEDVFDMYISRSKLIKIDDTWATVVVPNFITKTLLKNESFLVEECLRSVLGRSVPINVLTEEEYESLVPPIEENEFFDKTLDISQNFTNFVLGKSNIQAQAASLTCAKNLGLVYNPLFIYGNSGLGKTHLLNAIGNEVHNTFPSKKIGFITGIGFVEALARSKKENCIDELKNTFYELDLLLVDDIQFIAGKTWTQEVFFSIFNVLVNNRKQICITADRSPDEIKGLEDRLLSRFNQGLNVNIESPEYETSIKILKMKIANNISVKEKVDEEVLSFIATNFSQNVRTLEGAVNRLLFYYINFNVDNEDHITLKLASEAFKDKVGDMKNELNIAKVRKAVCDYYNITKQQICSANRTKNIAIPRHIAMYLCRKLLDAPFKEIGFEFGKRDHSTVINAYEKVESLIKTDINYQRAVSEIEKRINNNPQI